MYCMKKMGTYGSFLLDVFSFFFLHNLLTQKLDVFPQSSNLFLKSDKNGNIFLIFVWADLGIQTFKPSNRYQYEQAKC